MTRLGTPVNRYKRTGRCTPETSTHLRPCAVAKGKCRRAHPLDTSEVVQWQRRVCNTRVVVAPPGVRFRRMLQPVLPCGTAVKDIGDGGGGGTWLRPRICTGACASPWTVCSGTKLG